MSRIEKAALKRMVKNLAPYQKQIDRLNAKIAEIEAKKQPIMEQIDRLHEAINYYTGGVPYWEVLNPSVDEVDESPEPTTVIPGATFTPEYSEDVA